MNFGMEECSIPFSGHCGLIKLFEMIFYTVYLGTCIRRLNITKFDSIRMFIYA